MAKCQTQDDRLALSEALFRKRSPLRLMYGLIRIALGAIFTWSGAAKLIDPPQFAVIIEAFGIMPDPWVLPAAICLSVVELLAGVGLIMDLQGALGLVAGLLLLFMLILGYGLWMGLDVDCGCFGPGDPESKAFHGLRSALYRDWAMLAAAVSLFWYRRQKGVSPLKLSILYNRYIAKGDITG